MVFGCSSLTLHNVGRKKNEVPISGLNIEEPFRHEYEEQTILTFPSIVAYICIYMCICVYTCVKTEIRRHPSKAFSPVAPADVGVEPLSCHQGPPASGAACSPISSLRRPRRRFRFRFPSPSRPSRRLRKARKTCR